MRERVNPKSGSSSVLAIPRAQDLTRLCLPGQRCGEPREDSYFVVEDMCVTFGVRLGTERVALYGASLGRPKGLRLFRRERLFPAFRGTLPGVVDGHGECGEVCAAFVRRGTWISECLAG